MVSWSFWQFGQANLFVSGYGSIRTTLTRLPTQSLGTMILALVAQGLATFSTTSKPVMCISMGFWATVFSLNIT